MQTIERPVVTTAMRVPPVVASRDAPPGRSRGAQLSCEIDVLEPFRDPVATYDFVADGIAGLLHDTLFRLDDEGGVTGGLATGWAARGRDWIVDLAPGRCFADGSAIGAVHVVAAIDALARFGARRWLSSLIADATAITDHRLLVRTTHPIGYLRELLSCVVFAPRAADPALESGPYRLAKAHPFGRGLLLVRDGPSPRAGYDGARWLSLLRTIDARQGVRLFRQGRLDVTCGTVFPHSLATEPDLLPALRTHPSLMLGLLLPNAARVAGLEDPTARRALSLAIDRRRLAADLAPVLEACHGLLSPWTDVIATAHAPGAARDAWKAAGRPVRRLTISYADFPPNGDLLSRVADDLERVLALDVQLKPLEYGAYVAARVTGDYEIAYAIHPAAFADPIAALLPFTIAGATPFTARPSPAFLEAFAAAEPHLDKVRRDRALRVAAAHLEATMPAIPLVRTRICHLVGAGLQAPVLPSGFPDYTGMRWTHD